MKDSMPENQAGSEKKEKKPKSFYAIVVALVLLAVMFCSTVVVLTINLTRTDPGDDIFSLNKVQSGLRVGDDEGLWQNRVQIAVFRTEYVNGEMVVIAKSSNGDNIIAPGTQNEYRFWIQNTSGSTVNFKLNMMATISATGYEGIITELPVTIRVVRDDGTYLFGTEEAGANVNELDGEVDTAVISPYSYVYYSFFWEWEFESGNDFWDTFLGSASANSSVKLTLAIGAGTGGGGNGNGDYSPIGTSNACRFCGKHCLCWLWITLVCVLTVGEAVTIVFLNKFMKKCNQLEEEFLPDLDSDSGTDSDNT